MRVDDDFAEEYPDGDAISTQAHDSLVRAGTAALQELDRCVEASFGVGQAAATTLAVLDGAGGPLTPSQISERMLVASASATATLDQLERHGWVRPTPTPRTAGARWSRSPTRAALSPTVSGRHPHP